MYIHLYLWELRKKTNWNMKIYDILYENSHAARIYFNEIICSVHIVKMILMESAVGTYTYS